MNVVYLVVFGSFACLFPLAFYCLVLASLNNRRRPTLVPGPADFAGVLVATAGFLIVGGPLILSGVHDAWRRTLLRGNFASIRGLLAEVPGPWLLVWLAYFLLVVVGALWLLWRRRSVSVVYNLDAATAHKLLPDLFDRLGLPWTRRGGVYAIGFSGSAAPAPVGPQGGPVAPGVLAVLEVASAPASRNLTLEWADGGGLVRRQVEGELREALEGVEVPENPAAGWLMAAASVLFVLLLIVLALFVIYLWALRG